MNALIAAYDSDASDDGIPSKAPATKKTKVDLAPQVATQDLTTFKYLTAVDTKLIKHNVPYEDLSKPVAGPSNPFMAHNPVNKNTLNGYVEEHNMDDFTFKLMQRTYDQFKYSLDPDGDGTQFIGDVQKAQEMKGRMAMERMPKNRAKKRKPQGDAADVDGFNGPWAAFDEEPVELPVEVAPETEENFALSAPPESKKPQESGNEKTIFHGKSEFDYLGRTYMHVPADIDGVKLRGESGDQECFLPKKLIHTWTGHTKAVNMIKFLPNSGHLLLSASMDCKVKLWDVYNDRRCLRTFIGHSKGVRDISFSNDGRQFLSCSYDKWVKLWDTETGKCLSAFNIKNIPHCVTFNPDPEKQNIFLTGCADKKIYQYDIKSGNITQEYDQHLGPVNTVTFVDDNRRFISTSDDKTLRAWEYDIPVVIKYVADPAMHSMPAVALSPDKKWLACQSLDNQILIYSAHDKFRMISKRFKGHVVAGYACKPSFSPDGRFVTSGDSTGMVWFWDWKTCRMVKRFKAHDSVTIGTEWHPHETSKVATCSWDGTIK